MVYAMTIDQNTFAPAKFMDIASLFNLILPIIMVGGALIFFVMLLQAAFMWLTSEGKPESILKAQKALIFAVIGLIVFISAFMIVKIIGIILNVPTL
jgi:hypothetical protein